MQSKLSQICIAILMLISMLAAGPSAVFAAPQKQEVAAKNNRVLIFSHTTGFRHKSIEAGVAAMAEMVRAKGMIPIASEDTGIFERGDIDGFGSIILISNTTSPKDPATDWLIGKAGENFQRWLERGGAIVGIHAASDSHFFQPWYGKMIGAYFVRHPQGVRRGRLKVADGNHPATKGWPSEVVINDEWYVLRDFDPRQVNLLLSLDPASIGEPAGPAWPISWTKQYGKSRVFYTALGHAFDSYAEPRFLAHVEGGLDWALAKK
jgi:uncharacterized protein